MTNPADMTPAEIDTELARLSNIEWTAWRTADQYRSYAAKTRITRMAAEYQAHADEQEAKAAAARREARPYHQEYAQRPWRRYFLVTNVGGHIHRGMDCSTCRQSTEYNWLIDLADCDEAAMVAEYGEMACTVCFPDAPTLPGFADGTSAQARRTADEQAARDAEKAAQAAEKASKAITAPDGTPLRVGYDTLRTKVAASRALSAAVKSYGWYGPTHPSDFAGQIATLVEALEAAGVETAPVITRALKASKAEGAEHVYRAA